VVFPVITQTGTDFITGPRQYKRLLYDELI
jgi:hypothetical protein